MSGISLQEVNGAFAANDPVGRFQELLKKGLHPDEHFGYDGTPVTMAAECENMEVLKLLIQHGGDLNKFASIHHKPALWFAVQAENEELIDFLLKNGAVLERSGALHQAVLQVNLPLVKFLLQRGADPLELEDGGTGQENRSLTALHRAVRPEVSWYSKAERVDKEPHLEIVRTLVGLGVDRHAKTMNGLTALDIAQSREEIPQVTQLLVSFDEVPPKS